MNAGTKIERKQLSYPMLINCVDTIRANLASFTERALTDEQLATELTSKCGFAVTEVNARTARHAASAKWPVKRARVSNARPRKAALCSPNVVTLAKALLEVGKALGHAFTESADLQRIADARPKIPTGGSL